MRVKLTFSVESEEVPEYIADLGTKADLEIRDAINALSTALNILEESERNFDSVLEVLDKVRKKLAKADIIIGDMLPILIGLGKLYNGENNVPERRLTMDTSGNTTVPPGDTGEG